MNTARRGGRASGSGIVGTGRLRQSLIHGRVNNPEPPAIPDPRRLTKPKSEVWKYFNKLDIDGAKQHECKFCKIRYKSEHATRFVKHLLVCRRCPERVKQKFRKETETDDNRETEDEIYTVDDDDAMNVGDESPSDEIWQTPNRATDNINSSTSSSSNSQSQRPNSSKPSSSDKSDIKCYAKIISKKEQDQLNELFARAVYTSGIGYMTLTDNEEWEQFFRKLNPAYKLPNRHMLATTLLDAEHVRVDVKVKEILRAADTLCVQLDGWTNRRGEAVINVIITTPKPVLFKTIETKLERHNHENLASLIEGVMDEIDLSKFEGIITDNASAMLKASSLVATKHPHIHSYSCAAHSLNLLIQDVMKMNSAKELIAECSEVVTKVNGGSLLRAAFNKLQLEKSQKVISLKHHVKTRWTSWRSCLTSLLNTQNALKFLWIDDEYANLLADKKNLKSRILDDGFWLKVRDLNNFIKKTVEFIVVLESNTPQISYVAECFLKIKHEMLAALPSTLVFTSDEKTIIQSLLETRENKMLYAIHFAANILDPNFRGKILSETQEITGMQFIEKKINQVFCDESDRISALGDLASYRCAQGFYAHEYVQKSAETISALTWWMGTCTSTKISQVARKILAMPATSAATERSFSTQSFIHSARRNRLTASAAGKITFVKCNIQLAKGLINTSRLALPDDLNECDYETLDEDLAVVNDEFEIEDSDDDYQLFEFEVEEIEF